VESVAAALARACEVLARSSETPRLDAQVLLSHVLGRGREWLIAHGETLLTQDQSHTYARLYEKRADGVPVAYLTGFAGFYKREFAVNEHVLIPRPETEHMVEDAIAHLKPYGGNVFEAGVGSGAIACSIAAEVPGAMVYGTDASAQAIATAQDNARRLGVADRCVFYLADVVNDGDEKQYEAIVANLPYIPTQDVPRKPEPAGYEPRMALDGGVDGLDLYRKLLAAAPRMLRPGALLLMEAAPPTIEALRRITAEAFPWAALEVRRDYAGQERYVYVKTAAER
jgi:release factor glutamine methyltransferase